MCHVVFRSIGGKSACLRVLRGSSILVAVFALVLSSCSGQGGSKEIAETRTVTSQPAAPAGQQLAMTAPAPAAMYSWEVPEGWVAQPATSTRLANFKVDPDTDAECYLTVLGGTGGGVEANINRWRAQLSLEPYTPAEMAELPTLKVLGQDALLVECEGTFKGMGGGATHSGYKLLGIILEDAGKAVFVKMTGPAAVVDREKPNFEKFCQSLKPVEGAQMASQLPEGHPDIGGAGLMAGQSGMQLPPGHPDVSNLSDAAGTMGGPATAPVKEWKAPDSWSRTLDKPMRIVTYTLGESGQTECYVTSLSGAAGGVDANINRWRQQMGQPVLDADALAALPKITILGKPSPMVEVDGSFTGMNGEGGSGYTLLGAICPVDGETVFVKMTGPSAEVKAAKDSFIAFCESLK